MKPTRLIVSMLVGLILLATACSPQVPATVAVQPTTMPTAVVPATGSTLLKLGKDASLGSFLVDDKGMTLYLFTKDTPNTSNCYDKCATSWPPLLTTGNPVSSDGIDASKLGTTKRKDGAVQVTYNGWPLYYFAKDKAAGDVTGQDVGSVWFVVSPAGEKIESAQATEPAAAATEAATAAPTSASAAAGAAMVNLGKADKLGSFLVDDKGMTLYLFTKDTPNTSVCYDKCAAAWPPLLTSGAPVAGQGVDASKFGTTTRKDGSTQVTYNGWPLYYFEKDKAPGDVTGQGVGDVWYVVSAAGEQINP